VEAETEEARLKLFPGVWGGQKGAEDPKQSRGGIILQKDSSTTHRLGLSTSKPRLQRGG
jgi:hypothetical protein